MMLPLFHPTTMGLTPIIQRGKLTWFCTRVDCPACRADLKRGTFDTLSAGVLLFPFGRDSALAVSHALFTLSKPRRFASTRSRAFSPSGIKT